MIFQTLYLVRHAESTMSGRYCGSTNARLNIHGITQAKSLSKFFASIPLDACFHSGLKRTKQTAEHICVKKEMTVRESPNLREIYFGKWERRRFDYVERYWPRIYSQWIHSPNKVQIPSGESFSRFRERVQTFADELIRTTERNSVVVAHGGSLSVLMMALLKKPLNQFWKWIPSPASISVLRRELNHGISDFNVIRFKDTSHL